MELSLCYGEDFLVGTWKTEPVKNVKFEPNLEIFKSDEFIIHMSFVYLAYSAYKTECGHLSPFLLNKGQV